MGNETNKNITKQLSNEFDKLNDSNIFLEKKKSTGSKIAHESKGKILDINHLQRKKELELLNSFYELSDHLD